MLIRFDENDYLIGIVILCSLLPILWKQKRNFSFLLFFSIFWIYLLVVVQTVIFPIAINTNYSEPRIMPRINLVPFYFGYCSIPKYRLVNIVGNIILTTPFGFGINFLLRVKPRSFLWLAFGLGCGFEFSQLVISLAFRSGFRTIDINDAMLNAAGVLIGYGLFRVFAWIYLKIGRDFQIKYKWLFADIYGIVLQTQITDKL